MLTIAIELDGGVTIQATGSELRDLAAWILGAALRGEQVPVFVTAGGATHLRILRLED